MKPFPVLMLPLLGMIGTASADVITGASCQIGANPVVSSPTSCSINPPRSAPSASASVAINQLTTIPSQGLLNAFTVTTTESVDAIPLSNLATGANIASSAAANATAAYQFLTLGPVRPGLLTYTGTLLNWQVGSGNNPAQVSVSLGALSGSCAGLAPSCTGPLLGSPAQHSVAFTLGNAFGFQFSQDFTAFGDPISEGEGFASATTSFRFQLFEADGTTPVALYSAPEPGTLGLLLICLGGGGAFYGIRIGRANH